MSTCADCGSVQEEGASCQQCFDALLAFEYEHPVAFGAVHHLTVSSFYLQHPQGYSLEALDAWRALLTESLQGRRTQREILAAMSARFEGAKRVRDRDGAKPKWWPEAWPMTIRDVFDPNRDLPAVDEYVERARAWAESIHQCLDNLVGLTPVRNISSR
jgi:hypothetical protein